MAHEPIPSERKTSDWTSDEWPSSGSAQREPASPDEDAPDMSDFGSDAALVLSALARMEASIRGERLALGRLRTALLETARNLALAKAALAADAARSGALPAEATADLGTLFDEIEHRVDAMIEIAGCGEQAGAAAPSGDELAAVPTVSGVVSRLGRGQEEDDAMSDARAEDERGAIPTVSMLQAMVEALNAPGPEAADLRSEPVAEAAEPSPAAEAAAVEPLREIAPGEEIDLERALLANLARIESYVVSTAAAGSPEDDAQPAESRGEADPAAFLYRQERTTEARSASADDGAPPPEVPTAPPEAPAPETAAAQATTAGAPDGASAADTHAPTDPLAPLNAMTAAERLALFS